MRFYIALFWTLYLQNIIYNRIKSQHFDLVSNEILHIV